MTSEVRFQDPGADSGYLLQALIESCERAERGGAIFAWTNSGGAKALLEDEVFVSFAERGTFDLVVGIDSITDERAIRTLIDIEKANPGLRVRVFMHEQARPMFHPKLAWFSSRDGLTLMVGSGNLTTGGLKGNWEAFSVNHLTDEEAAAAEKGIHAWLEAWDDNLVSVTDPSVLERAKRNVGHEGAIKRAAREPAESADDEDASILIAEIPMAGDRWSQANFHLEDYEGFFGAKVGTQRRIVLYSVSPTGELGEIETRPSVEVRSKNYRFELSAARGLDYPSEGRPIGVFLRLSTGEFLYMLLMPGSDNHARVAAFLDDHYEGREDWMRRVRTTVAELKAAWPRSPLWTTRLPQL